MSSQGRLSGLAHWLNFFVILTLLSSFLWPVHLVVASPSNGQARVQLYDSDFTRVQPSNADPVLTPNPGMEELIPLYTLQWTKVGNFGSFSNAVGNDTLYSSAGQGVGAVDLTTPSPSSVSIGLFSDLEANSYDYYAFGEDASNEILWFQNNLYWGVKKFAGNSQYIVQVWKYNGTPHSWSKVFDSDVQSNRKDNSFVGDGFFKDGHDGYMYVLNEYGNYWYTTDGSTWSAMQSIPDGGEPGGYGNESNHQRGWKSPDYGRTFVYHLYTNNAGGGFSDYNMIRFENGQAFNDFDSYAGYPTPTKGINAVDYKKIWRVAGGISWTEDESITPSTTWHTPSNMDILASPTYNLYGYSIGVDSSSNTGFVHLWNETTQEWETSHTGNISDLNPGTKYAVLTFRLPANGETYMVVRRGASSYYLVKKDVTLPPLAPLTYLVSGAVLDADNNPITNASFLVTTAATSTTLTTTTTITPFIDATGRYTLTDYISGTISVITATAQSFEMFPPFLYLPETGQVFDADFVGTLPPDPLPVPTNTQFKGANWLRFLDDNEAEGNTNYEQDGIGWNLEYATDFEYSDAPVAQLLELRGREQVYTVMRLDKRLPPITELPLEEYDNCDNTRLQQWMKELDDQYAKAFNYMINDTNTVVAFIFNNEPNHYNPNTGAEDEGRAISAKYYADLYNCYYERWRVENNNPHSLLVAGPAQHGRPPGTYGPTDLGSENWDTFLTNLLPNLDGADGFAVHVYGYYGTKNEQINLFQNMLDTQVNQIRASHLAERPILISEYNPGVPASESDKDANDPPQGDGEDGWRDWFDKTYCWMQDTYTPQVRGALYFTDEEDSNRSQDSQGGWWISSLDRHDGTDPTLPVNRRQLWLDAPSEACDQILTMSKPSSGLSSPLAQNQTLSSQISRPIGGVISGTLGVWGYDNVFYVTDDLEVPISQTLTIVPGTWLVFSPGQSLKVTGKLNVEANTVFPVRFISTNESGWEGIHFQTSAGNSYCVGCYIENLNSNGVALRVDAPITFREGRIRDVPNGTAISSTIPFTLSNVVIDYVGTALQITSLPTVTYSVSYLTISRCQQGIVNYMQTLILNNSILTTCGIAVTTKLSGTTAISYSLLHDNGKNFVIEAGGQLIQGTGLLTTTPGFVDFPDNFHLQPDSAAVNAADPQADYSQESGYNGNRADLGAYGNTREAPQQPPLDQMAVSLQTDTFVRSG